MMFSGEHPRINTLRDSVLKKLPSPFNQVYTLCEQVSNRTQPITGYAYRRFLTSELIKAFKQV